MRLTFLGTGSSLGTPQPACKCKVCSSKDAKDIRLRSSVHITDGHSNIIIDSGPDFRTQVLKHNINNIDALLLTHSHRDHVAGLDDVRGFNWVNRKSVDVYTSIYTANELKRIFYYIFLEDKDPALTNVNINIINKDSTFSIKGINFQVIEVKHNQMCVLGFRINNLAYITDVNYVAEDQIAKLQNLDILVLNALQQDHHISQFTLKEAISFSKRLKAKKTFFTHIGHKMGLYREVSKTLEDSMFLAYDGLTLNF